MPMIREQMSGSYDGGQRSQARSASDQEHDEELILHGIGRLDAGENLPRHHSRQGNKTDCRHAVNGRHEAASQSVPDYRQQRLISRAAERKTSFYRGSFAHQTGGEYVKAQAYTGHGVTQDHAQQGQRVARMVPGFGTQLREERKRRHRTRSQQSASRTQTVHQKALQSSPAAPQFPVTRRGP